MSPTDFLGKMERGEFDGRLPDEIDKLSESELEELAFLLTKRLRTKAASA